MDQKKKKKDKLGKKIIETIFPFMVLFKLIEVPLKIINNKYKIRITNIKII